MTTSTLEVERTMVCEKQTEKAIRVLLVDDHPMVRRGLRSFLETYPDVEVVGEAGNGEEALQSVQMLSPSVVLMDINMPRLNGIEATARIKHINPHIVVLGLSVHVGEVHRRAMTAAGATAVISKEAAVEQLYHEIVKVRGPAL